MGGRGFYARVTNRPARLGGPLRGYARPRSRHNPFHVLGSLGAAAYRPDVIRELGAKVNGVVKGLRKS